MLPIPARNVSLNSRGFTAIEIAVTVVIVGVLAAISAPSMIGWYQNAQVADAVDRLEGALKEAQREAIKRTTDCTVTIPTGNAPNLASSTANCLTSGDRNFANANLTLVTGSSASVAFDYKGRQTNAELRVLISNPQSPSATTRCLVTSQGLGVIRTGTWNSTTSICNIRR
jgi:prepilin-type N-terminal cleavage/methylation domain-containing protein